MAKELKDISILKISSDPNLLERGVGVDVVKVVHSSET